jgi:MFS family permease
VPDRRSTGGILGVLTETEYRKLFFGQAVSVVGTVFTTVALPFAVLDIGGTATDIGIVEAANLVPLLVFLLVGGVWADRLPRQRVMLVADLCRAALQVVAATLLVSGVAHIWHLVLLQIGMGACEAFFRPAYTGLVPQTVSPERLRQANGLMSVAQNVALTAGAALGGVLVAAVGAGWAIGLDGITFVISAVFLWRLRPRLAAAVAAASEPGTFVHDLAAGWREFVSHTWLWVMVAGASAFLFFVDAPAIVLGPVVASEYYDGARTFGFVIAAMGVGQISGSLAAMRWRPARPLLVVSAGMATTAVPLALFASRAPVTSLVIAFAVMGVEWGLYDTFWVTSVQQHVAPEAISRVSSYDFLGSLAFYPAGLVLAGPLSRVLGVSGVLWLGAGMAVVISACQLLARDVRQLTWREAVPDGDETPAGGEASGGEQALREDQT